MDSSLPLPSMTSPWVPIRQLAVRHRARVLGHLLSLGEADRYLRFGYAASDEQIKAYVSGLNFDTDTVLGVFNRRLQLVAVAHIAFVDHPLRGMEAEFGVSVLPTYRGRGLGAALFERAMTHARTQGASTMVIHTLSSNAAMLKIAAKAGALVQRDHGEVEGHLLLPPAALKTHVSSALEGQLGLLDYRLKQHRQNLNNWLKSRKQGAMRA